MTQEQLKDPFAVDSPADYDPFASADEAAAGGNFVPWPGVEDVADRLIVLVPRRHNPEATVSQYLQDTYQLPPTREEWKVDLVVLDGAAPFEYTYMAKDGDTFKEAKHVIETLPALIPGWKVVWGNIIGTLNKINEGPRPFALGRIRAGYSAKEMRNGKTFDQFAEELAAFYKSPKGKKQPKPVWHMVVSDDAADRAAGLAWYRQAVAEGFKI